MSVAPAPAPQDGPLTTALAKVRELELSRDAMLSSIESLKVLVSNERALARVAKRKLAATAKSLENATDRSELSDRLKETEASLRGRDSKIQRLTAQQDEAKKREQGLREQAEALKENLSHHHKVLEENEKLRESIQGMRKQLESKEHAKAKQKRSNNGNRERVLEKMLKEKDESAHVIEKQLRDERARVEALNITVANMPALRSRIKDLENDKDASQIGFLSEQEPVDVKQLDEAVIKRKLFELKIARNVIREKDKTVRAMREKVETAEGRELEAVFAYKVSEQHAKNAEDALRETKLQLGQMQVKLDAEAQTRVDKDEKTEMDVQAASKEVSELSAKVKRQESDIAKHTEQNKVLLERANHAEQNFAKAKDELAAMSAELRQSDECKDHQSEMAEEQQLIVQSRQDELAAEIGNLKSALSVSEKEVKRLENILAARANPTGHPGDSSPCSTDAGLDEQHSTLRMNMRNMSDCEATERVCQLEEAVRVTKSSYEQKCLETQALASSVSDNATTIVTLNRALLVSRNSSDEKHRQLEETMARANSMEKSVRTLKSEISSRNEECDFLENRIRFELEPSLLQANSILDQRTGEMKTLRDECDLQLEASKKTRAALEQRVGDLSKRLHNTTTSLNETQNKLSMAEQTGADLEIKISTLSAEKQRNIAVIEDLSSHCEHRQQALVVLQARLTECESGVATQEQAAMDAIQTAEELREAFTQACERQVAAEGRALRGDVLLEEMEQRGKKLERSHISVMEHMVEKTAELAAREEEALQLNNVVTVTKEALEKQAQIACNRESLFDSHVAELRGVIRNQNGDIKTLQQDMGAMERRTKFLNDELARANSELARTEHDLVQAKRQHSAIIGDCKRQQTKLAQLQGEISRLRAESQAAQEELVARDQQISSHLQSITEKGSQIAGLRASKNELEKRVADVRSQLTSEQARCQTHVHGEQKLGEQLERVSVDLAHAEEELSVKVMETETLNKRLSTAQSDVMRLEGIVSEKEEEIKSYSKAVKKLEIALERSKQQLQVLESHLNGHDTLLEEYREKEEVLATKCEELDQSHNRIEEMEQIVQSLREKVASQTEEIKHYNTEASTFEAANIELQKELTTAEEARALVNEALKSTASKLKDLEKSTADEIESLRIANASLQTALDGKESSLSSASEVITHNSVQGQFAKEQLIESRTRGDRLFERLTAAEYELASKNESLLVFKRDFLEMQEKMDEREHEIEKLERNLHDRNQALALARSRVDEVGAKTANIAQGEVLSMRTKLESKEKAIANLHNWCCFINGKLHAAEKSLSEQTVDLEVSETAFKKLEARLLRSNECISQKEAHIREIESAKGVENSELHSRVATLKSQVEEANLELEKVKGMMAAEGGNNEVNIVAMLDEMRQSKEKLQLRDLEVSRVQARSQSLQEELKKYERDFCASQRTVELLTLDVARLRAEANSKRDARDTSDKKDAMEVSKVRSETGYLLVELRRAEAELAAANENVKAWQTRAQKLEPLAESTLEAQRTTEMVSSRLALAEKDSSQRIDLLQTQLEEARRERDVAERDCAAAMADYAAARARLNEAGSRYGGATASKSLCAVTFTLEGATVPSADITVYILGGDSTLGNWEPSRRVPMRVVSTGRTGVTRKCDVLIAGDVSTFYKFAADGVDGSLVWEGGENRALDVGGRTQHQTRDVWRSPL